MTCVLEFFEIDGDFLEPCIYFTVRYKINKQEERHMSRDWRTTDVFLKPVIRQWRGYNVTATTINEKKTKGFVLSSSKQFLTLNWKYLLSILSTNVLNGSLRFARKVFIFEHYNHNKVQYFKIRTHYNVFCWYQHHQTSSVLF